VPKVSPGFSPKLLIFHQAVAWHGLCWVKGAAEGVVFKASSLHAAFQKATAMKHHNLYLALLAGMSLAATGAIAKPALMVQPKDAQIISSGPGFGSITDTFNQSGLNTGYVDEVTNLHPYTATASHTLVFSGFEWFGNQGTDTATVSYFVNSSLPFIDHLVLWNEESSGIGQFNLWYGTTAGEFGTLLLDGVSPTDHDLVDYLPDVWEFAPSSPLGWYTIQASGCPQPIVSGFASCAIGEVAFGGPAVPEPGIWAMLIAGFGLVGYAARRRRVIAAQS